MDNKIRRRKVSTNNTQKETKSSPKRVNKKIEERKKRQKQAKIKRLFKTIKLTILSFVIVFTAVFSYVGISIYNNVFNSNDVVDEALLKEHYVSSEIAMSEEIPQFLKDAIVSIEDERFYTHKGVDYKSLARAFIHNSIYKTSQGGSTIEMQLSKNLLTSMDKTIKRKLNDIKNAIQMNKSMTKDEILTCYLNNIYLGKSAYGVKKGAKVYFGKDLYSLSLAECAMLAGITNNPSKYGEYINAKSRQELILSKMKELGYIDETQYKEAMREKVVFKSEID